MSSLQSQAVGVSESAGFAEVHQWLAKRLEQDRIATIEQLSRQHAVLLNEFYVLTTEGSNPISSPIRSKPEALLSTGEVLDTIFQTRTQSVAPHPSDANAMSMLHSTTREVMDSGIELEQDLPDSTESAKGDASTIDGQQNGQAGDESGNANMEVGGSKPPSRRGVSEILKNKKRPHRGGSFLERLVGHPAFEAVTGGLIVGCVLVMIFELQWHGLNRGHDLGFLSRIDSGRHIVPFGGELFHVLHVLFNVSFTVEFTLRIAEAVYSKSRFCTKKIFWIVLDVILVMLSWVEFGYMVSGVKVKINPTMGRMLRFLRILRLVRLLEDFSAFHSLFILVRSLQVSMGAVVWSFILILSIQTVVALVISNSLVGYMTDTDNPQDARKAIYVYFGTFTRSLITMFEISMANWVPTCRLLIENVGERWMAFYILYRCMFIFALIRVITAVFIAETNRMMAADDDLEVQKRVKMKQKLAAKMKVLFNLIHCADKDHFKLEDFQRRLNDDTLKAWLLTMEIDATDLNAMFEIIDDIDQDNGDGIVQMKDFITGLTLMKGPARSLDVLYLRKQMNQVLERCDEIAKAQSKLPVFVNKGVVSHWQPPIQAFDRQPPVQAYDFDPQEQTTV